MNTNKYTILEELVNTTDNEELKTKLKSLLKEHNRISKQLDKIIKISDKQQLDLRNLNTEIKSQKDKVQFLLDNSSRGFFSFGKNFKINQEYSKECINIFLQDIADKFVYEILTTDPIKQNDYKFMFAKILNEKEQYKMELFLSLLENEINIDDKYYQIEYKLINNNTHIMVILTDKTKEKRLQEHIQNEQNKFKFIVTVLQNRDDFFKQIDEFKLFLSNIDTFANKELLRYLHTFKGTFAQLNFINLPNLLHEAENNVLRTIKINNQDLSQAMENDIQIIQSALDKDFFNQEIIHKITEEKLKEFEYLAHQIKEQNLLKDEKLINICNKIHTIRDINLKLLLQPHIKYCYKKAQALDILIEQNEIIGDDIYVNKNKFVQFTTSLIHIYNNILSHGIEKAETREMLNKNIQASIKTTILKEQNNITIAISDDGNGIDTIKIKQKLIEKNIKTVEELELLPENELFNFIFLDNFSTATELTDIQGRGVGLSAVKEETTKLNGNIQIVSKQNIGTTFIFMIPIN